MELMCVCAVNLKTNQALQMPSTLLWLNEGERALYVSLEEEVHVIRPAWCRTAVQSCDQTVLIVQGCYQAEKGKQSHLPTCQFCSVTICLLHPGHNYPKLDLCVQFHSDREQIQGLLKAGKEQKKAFPV